MGLPNALCLLGLNRDDLRVRPDENGPIGLTDVELALEDVGDGPVFSRLDLLVLDSSLILKHYW